jgi:hypothetical protein
VWPRGRPARHLDGGKNADISLERAHVIIDPHDGKIPYRPEALARQRQNFANRATADPKTRCFQPSRARFMADRLSDLPNNRAVHVYQDVHAYRIIYLDGQHNEGLGYAMGDSRGHWRGIPWWRTSRASATRHGLRGRRLPQR